MSGAAETMYIYMSMKCIHDKASRPQIQYICRTRARASCEVIHHTCRITGHGDALRGRKHRGAVQGRCRRRRRRRLRPPRTITSRLVSSLNMLGLYKSLYDYTPQDPETELALTEDAILYVLDKEDEQYVLAPSRFPP